MNELNPSLKKIGAASLVLAVLIPFAFQISEIYVDPSDPGFGAKDVPRLVVGLGFFLCIMMIWSAAKTKSNSGLNLKDGLRAFAKPFCLAVIALFYIWCVTAFQYALPTFVLLASLAWYFGSRSVRDVIIVPAVAVTLYYAIFFVLLGIYEEPGSILYYDSYGVSQLLRQAIGLQ